MSTTDTEDDPMRAFAKALFGRDDETAEDDADAQTDDAQQKKLTGNFVPLEGNNPHTQDNSDEEFLRLLFDA